MSAILQRASDLRIRDAQVDDLAWLAEGALAMAWETERKRLDADTVRAGIAAGVADPAKARYFVAERGGARAGTLMLTAEWSDWRNGAWWWIQSVYVMPAHRRQGVYAALYRHVEALARETADVVGLRLYVERDNAAALRTYAALGMRDAGYRLYEAEFT
ncbi:MAG: GNAT family N-acetyltransferase [Luteimonas sp.]